MSTGKDPVKSAAGKAGARVRWGEFGIRVRLDRVQPDTRRIIEAALAAERNAAIRTAPEPERAA